MLVLCAKLADFGLVMKKLFSVVALLALVSMVLVGCKPAEETPKAPETPPTNAPAPPK